MKLSQLKQQIEELDAKATKGPWKVYVTEHPHYLGGTHVERRIGTEWDHPQLKGPDPVVNGSWGIPAVKGEPGLHMVSIREYDGDFIALSRTAMPELLRRLLVAEEAFGNILKMTAGHYGIDRTANAALKTIRGEEE